MRKHSVNSIVLINSTATNSPSLKALQVSAGAGTLQAVLSMVQACPHLEHLLLYDCGRTDGEILQIVANMQIKRFTVCNYSWGKRTSLSIFVNCLDQRPHLAFLQINKFIFDAAGQFMDVTAVLPRIEVLEKAALVFNKYPSFDFRLRIKEDFDLTVEKLIAPLARFFEDRLEELLVWYPPASVPQLSVFLTKCGPSLAVLELHSHGVEISLLLVIGKHCPLLKFLLLKSKSPDLLQDDGIIAVIRGCSKLQQLTATGAGALTTKTLEAIIENKLRLKTLKLEDFKAVDAALFCQQCKAHSLLPIPHVVFSKTG